MTNFSYIGEKSFLKQKRKRGLSFLGMLKLLVFGVLLILIFLGYKIGKEIYRSAWDGVNRLTFALSIDKIALISYNPKNGEVVAILIPDETQLEMTRGYGKYQIASVPKLEELEKRSGLLVESLQENLGVPVDGWLFSKDEKSEGVIKDDVLKSLSGQIVKGGDTNLSRWDLAKLWWDLRQLRFDKFKTVDLSELGVLKTRELPDSTKVLGINSLSLDPQIQKLFFEEKIREEDLRIEILNATTHPGLAERGARILSNIGGDVVFVGNSEDNAKNCQIQSKEENKNTYTVKKISKIFNCVWNEQKEEGKGEVLVILGEDYWEKLTQK